MTASGVPMGVLVGLGLVCAAGLAGAAWAAARIWRAARPGSSRRIVSGRVVSLIPVGVAKPPVDVVPIVEFADADGATTRRPLGGPSPAGRYGLGQAVRVWADQTRPDRCEVVHDNGLLIAVVGIALTVVIIGGLLLLVLGTGWMRIRQ